MQIDLDSMKYLEYSFFQWDHRWSVSETQLMQNCFHAGLYHSKSWSVLSIPNGCMLCFSYYRPFLTGLYDCKDSAKHPPGVQAGNSLLEMLKFQLLKRHWSTNTPTHPIVDSMWWLDAPTNIPFELLWIHILTEKSLPKAMGFQHSSHLVGGFNLLEKYWSKWESSPSRGENKKYLKPPSWCVCFVKHVKLTSRCHQAPSQTIGWALRHVGSVPIQQHRPRGHWDISWS